MYSEVNRILIFFTIENLEDVVLLVKSLESEGKIVRAYSYTKKGMDNTFLPHAFHVWNKKQLNVLSIPRKSCLNEIDSFPADTLIDLTMAPSIITDYMFFFTNADYRVGLQRQYPQMYDLLLTVDQEHDFSFFSSQLLFYLKSIRTS